MRERDPLHHSSSPLPAGRDPTNLSFTDDLEYQARRLELTLKGYVSRTERVDYVTSAADQLLALAAMADCRAKLQSLGNPAAPAPSVASVVTITTAPATIAALGTKQMVAVVTDSDGNVRYGRLVTWNSATPAKATINASGLVTGVASGTTNITAICEGITSAAVVITVS